MATSRDLQRYRRRGTTTERGLDARHQKLSKQMRAAAAGQPCPGPYYGRRSANCTGVLAFDTSQLDDKVPRAEGGRSYLTGGRVCCTPCNTSAGARYGNARRPRRHPHRAGRTCEVCGRGYTATYAEQRTCGRSCGTAVRGRAASPGRSSRAVGASRVSLPTY